MLLWILIACNHTSTDDNVSMLIVHTLTDSGTALISTSGNFRFSAAVAEFGMLLRSSEFKQGSSYQQVLSLAKSAKVEDKNGYCSEFIQLVDTAHSLVQKCDK